MMGHGVVDLAPCPFSVTLPRTSCSSGAPMRAVCTVCVCLCTHVKRRAAGSWAGVTGEKKAERGFEEGPGVEGLDVGCENASFFFGAAPTNCGTSVNGRA